MVLRHGRAEVQVRVLVPLAMLLASAGQMAVEASFTNVAVITALFAILMGELCYAQLAAGWARWSESMVAWLCAAGRWAWLMRALNEQPLAQVDWREQQFRRDRCARALFAWAEPLGELTSGERESAVIQDYYRTLRELGMIGRSR